MPIPLAPLIWLGLGAAGIYGANAANQQRLKSQGQVGYFPGEGEELVAPQNGSILCCEVYHVLDHTGVWCDGQIVELNGNGLVRAISPQRFLKERSGSQIYVACDQSHQPLANDNTAEVAISQVFTFRDYALLKENCHGFVAECIAGIEPNVVSFSQLNQLMANVYEVPIHWQKMVTL